MLILFSCGILDTEGYVYPFSSYIFAFHGAGITNSGMSKKNIIDGCWIIKFQGKAVRDVKVHCIILCTHMQHVYVINWTQNWLSVATGTRMASKY